VALGEQIFFNNDCFIVVGLHCLIKATQTPTADEIDDAISALVADNFRFGGEYRGKSAL
jgi:predicted regulator of Ras-like GTPase activity (Roadblock/LC7/MglB family)